jgi:hypothetical protein
MNSPGGNINRLFSLRNKYGKQTAAQKIQLLQAISGEPLRSKKAISTLYDSLLFILAHPDNKTIYTLSNRAIQQLELFIQGDEKISENLYNTGIAHTSPCAAFSFEMVKWLRKTDTSQVKIHSFEATDDQIKFILSAVMTKLESEILQDANAHWKEWLLRSLNEGEDLLDAFIALFESAPLRPEVKDELWNAMGLNVEIKIGPHACLSKDLVKNYYHRALNRKPVKQPDLIKPTALPLTQEQAAQIINHSRKILICHIREIDPISFTAPSHVRYYQLARGISIALMGMVPERRHPVDSYTGYVAFKNGLPVAYGASWILFDSGRIGLNVFPAYRGGESQYIFQQVLLLHRTVFRLKRFSVDPYQIGKQNSDGIRSGAFWIYYRAGFRPVLKAQQELAAGEALKIKTSPGYRSPMPVLKKLADCRLQLILDAGAVHFDATDLSLAWLGILSKTYNNDRSQASLNGVEKLARILNIKDWREENMHFILSNWSPFLLVKEKELRLNKELIKMLKTLFVLKATGSEEKYIGELQRANSLRKYLEELLKEFKVAI